MLVVCPLWNNFCRRHGQNNFVHLCQVIAVLQVKTWDKFLNYDWDPELFSAFLLTFPLDFKILVDNVKLAVNHDPNIESIVEQGLALLDDLEEEENRKNKLTKETRQNDTDTTTGCDGDSRKDCDSKENYQQRLQPSARTEFLTKGPGALAFK